MKFFANARYQFALLVALCCASTFVGAQQVVPGTTPQNSIDNMQVSQQQGVTIVKLTMKKTLSAPVSVSRLRHALHLILPIPRTVLGGMHSN